MTKPIMNTKRRLAISVMLSALACAVSCSKTPGPVPLPPDTVKLGQVELAPEIPSYFSLGAHRSCSLTARQVTNGIEINVEIMGTNADGAITHAWCKVETLSGRACAVAMGGEGVSFTPVLKGK